MDADRFDSLSKRVAAPTTRRATLGAMIAGALGLGGAAPAALAAQADQGQICTMAFVAAVRLGPSVSQPLPPGGSQPGQLQGELSFTLAKSGNLEQAALTLPSGAKLPVVGQASGLALQLRINLDGRVALVAMGVGEADIAECTGAIDGTTAGPQMGDLGDWHARAKGLTGDVTAAGGGNRNRAQGSQSSQGGQGGRQSGQGGQGGSTGSGSQKDEAARTGREDRGGDTGSTEKKTDKKKKSPAAGTPPCATGQTDCNNVCVDLTKDPANCGGCGVSCEEGSCAAGVCSAVQAQGAECDAGFSRCGDTCVNLRNDQAHCGACQQACAAGVDCVNSTCGGSCPEGQSDCGDCADLMTSAVHCGVCFNACDAGVDCVNGVCGGDVGVACPDGQVDCGGVCTDLNVDPLNCGFCDIACAAGETCDAGFCSGGVAAAVGCLAIEVDCGGVCVDTFSDPAHCGGCGVTCLAGEECNGGVCLGQVVPPALDCAAQGMTDCGGFCVDSFADPANCGACGIACIGGDSCDGGICLTPAGVQPDCAAQGLTDCGGGFCADLTSDPGNCGGCGNSCAEGTSCNGGVCV